VLLASTFTLMMVKSAPSLSVRSILLYHKYILVIGIKLNIFVFIAVIHFINQNYETNLTHKKVIGLQNLDSESEELRPFEPNKLMNTNLSYGIANF